MSELDKESLSALLDDEADELSLPHLLSGATADEVQNTAQTDKHHANRFLNCAAVAPPLSSAIAVGGADRHISYLSN